MKKKLLFCFVSIVVLTLASIPIVNTINDIFKHFRSDNDVILLTMSGFEPNVLHLEAGVEKQVKLVNVEPKSTIDIGHGDEEGKHQRGIHQYASDELGFSYVLGPEEEKIITIKVDEPGEYEVYCDVCCGGKSNEFMRTKIIVN